ncbi:MAG: glycan biosynthesis hexose transferase WsfD, partial [Streptosporangiaceae bacterium]
MAPHAASGGAAPARISRLNGSPARWLSIFAASLTAFLIRFLVPVPVGQADNRDGPRLMCGRPPLGMEPLFPRGDPRYFRFAYFAYASSRTCRHHLPYPTSELGPLLAARALTPVFGLRGQLNLIALGVLMCVLASVAIASLVIGLRIRLWAQVILAAVIWVIVADAAFFDVFASPF